MKKLKLNPRIIALNRKARYEFFIKDEIEAGLILEGWEVKSLRQGRVSIAESYVFLNGGEGYVSGMTITPLKQASTHIVAVPTRVRKLLLSRRELDALVGRACGGGATLSALSLYWSGSWVKLSIGIVKGKKLHDKRNSLMERDWQIEKARIMKRGNGC